MLFGVTLRKKEDPTDFDPGNLGSRDFRAQFRKNGHIFFSVCARTTILVSNPTKSNIRSSKKSLKSHSGHHICQYLNFRHIGSSAKPLNWICLGGMTTKLMFVTFCGIEWLIYLIFMVYSTQDAYNLFTSVSSKS